MKMFKSIGLIFFASFLFLGVCGVSISEHFCKFSDELCESMVTEKTPSTEDHHCCEVSTKKLKEEKGDDCCEDEVKVFQTSLNHYHDVLVKVPQVFFHCDNILVVTVENLDLNSFYSFPTYPNPPPIEQRSYRSFLQVYTL